MVLTAQSRRLLDMIYRVGAPRFHEFSPAQARHSYRKLQLAFSPPAQMVGSVEAFAIARDDGSSMAARLYRPLIAPADATLPLFIHYHGGGWCVGDLDSYDVLCREIANGSGCAVLSVDFRLAPEHPFPAAPDDALLAARWARAEAKRLRIDPARFALGGDSAGGTLAIVTALSLRDAGEAPPLFLLLAYPSVEIGVARPSRETYGEGYFLDRETLAWFFANYRPDPADWRASPLRAPSLAGLPPILLIAAEHDPLIDDGTAFAERVAREGGEIARIVVPGVVHGFLGLGKLFPEAGEMLRLMTARLGECLWIENTSASAIAHY